MTRYTLTALALHLYVAATVAACVLAFVATVFR